MSRNNTKTVNIGNLKIGGGNPVAIQSMTATKTKDIAATVKAICKLQQTGCEIVRVAVLDREDALALGAIKKKIAIPLVADIHFDYRLALLAIEQDIDKLRINPGNIGDETRIKAVVDRLKEKRIPVRIGINTGSLEKDLLPLYKQNPVTALITSARRHVKILEKMDFTDIVLSIKATDPLITIKAYQEAAQTFPYPLHIGLTEAGTLFSGTIRSAAALGILLYNGIGDTVRISLTADPTEEIKVAKELLAAFGLYKKPILISCPTCGRIQYNMRQITAEIEQFLEKQGNLDIKVAIMGCAVNGPGEAREADIGIAGGRNSALLFKKGEIIRRVNQNKIVSVLKDEIIKFKNKKE